ncbi:MAG: hypothetical protein V1789_12640 [PVC group bacterium]
MSKNLPAPDDTRILIYQSDSGETRLEVRLQDESVWLTQNLMAGLYQTTQQNISLHIQNIYEEKELLPEATHKEFLSVRPEGTRTVQRLRDTELPVLSGPGTVRRDDACEWAQEQYDAFAERRRLKAEAQAEARYIEDLRTSAKMLETRRLSACAAQAGKKQPTKKKKSPKSRNNGGEKRSGKGGKS